MTAHKMTFDTFRYHKAFLLGLIFIALSWSTCCFAQDYRDVVFLKNGSVIKGFYKELYPGDSLRMETIDGGILVCAMKDVERIAKERTSLYVVNIQDSIGLPKRIWRPAGYKGFLEYGWDTNVSDNNLRAISFFTVHGYQFNRHVFIGCGLGLQQYKYELNGLTLSYSHNIIPIFGDLQLSLLRRRITPVLDCRAGYTVNGLNGLYLNPSVAVDFGITPRIGCYLSLGYWLQKYKENDENKKFKGLSFHVGIHF